MTANEFGKLLKTDICGCFLFYGEEQYLKSYYLQAAKKAICGTSVDELNFINISGDGKSIPEVCGEIASNASMPSFSGEKRLIRVFDLNLLKIKEDDLEELCSTLGGLKDFPDSVTIVITRPENFDAGTQKAPSKALKELSKSIDTVGFFKETPEKLSVWVGKHFQSSGLTFDKAVCDEMVRFVGRDMTSLSNEITKLIGFTVSKGKNVVDINDIRKVCCGNKEIDTFDFSNAILNGNTEKAFFILSDMKLHREAPEMILGGIMRVYGDLLSVKVLCDGGYGKLDISKQLKIHEYKTGLYMTRVRSLSKKGLEKAIELCLAADMRLKTASDDSYSVIENLIIKLGMCGRIR